jgi:universal stress protein A
MEIKTILVPVDFSEFTRNVMEYATFIAQSFHSRMIVVHVLQTFDIGEAVNWMETIIPAQPGLDLLGQIRESAEKQLASLKAQYADLPVSIITRIEEGVPFVEIVRLAAREEVDLIVMGSHGRTGIRHLLIGSVAEKVVRKAPCPVLCVKSKEFQFQMV